MTIKRRDTGNDARLKGAIMAKLVRGKVDEVKPVRFAPN